MAKVDYTQEGVSDVKIDTTLGSVTLGGVNYINDSKHEASIFKTAYLLGREHKKSQIAKALGLSKN